MIRTDTIAHAVDDLSDARRARARPVGGVERHRQELPAVTHDEQLLADLRALGDAPTLAAVVDVAERWALRRALVRASGNVSRAAASLDIGRATIDRRINALGLREWLTDEYERGARQPARPRATS